MKSALKSALTAAVQHLVYFAALIQLRSLEISLQGKCNTLPGVVCLETRANITVSIKCLSVEVVAARNRANALRPVRRLNGWRAAA